MANNNFNLFDFKAAFTPVSAAIEKTKQPAQVAPAPVRPWVTMQQIAATNKAAQPIQKPKQPNVWVKQTGIIPKANAYDFDDRDISKFRDLLSKWIEPERAKKLILQAKWMSTKAKTQETPTKEVDYWQAAIDTLKEWGKLFWGLALATAAQAPRIAWNVLEATQEWITNLIVPRFIPWSEKIKWAMNAPAKFVSEKLKWLTTAWEQKFADLWVPGFETQEKVSRLVRPTIDIWTSLIWGMGTANITKNAPALNSFVSHIAKNSPKIQKAMTIYSSALPGSMAADAMTRGKVDWETLAWNLMAPALDVAKSLPIIKTFTKGWEIFSSRLEKLIDTRWKLLSNIFQPGVWQETVEKTWDFIKRVKSFDELLENTKQANQVVWEALGKEIDDVSRIVWASTDWKIDNIVDTLLEDWSAKFAKNQKLMEAFSPEETEEMLNLLKLRKAGWNMLYDTKAKQNIKLFLDENYKIYSKAWDVLSSEKAKLLDDARKYIRASIEQDFVTAGKPVNVREINQIYDGLRNAKENTIDLLRRARSSEEVPGTIRKLLKRVPWIWELFRKPWVTQAAILEESLWKKTKKIVDLTEKISKWISVPNVWAIRGARNQFKEEKK